MKRQILSLLILPVLLAGCGEHAPEQAPAIALEPNQDKLRASVVVHAEQMQKEFMAGNLDAFVAYMHPDIIPIMGGVEKVKATVAPDLANMLKTIEGTDMGKVSDVLVDSGRYVAVVPVETLYKFPDSRLLQTTYRIACSRDDGGSWTFMDGQGRRDQEDFFRQKFPVLGKYVAFPKCTNKRVK